VGHIACIGDRKGAYKVLVGKLEGKRPLGRFKSKWKGIIMAPFEVGWRVGHGLD
jgi:hypothetical protein